MSADHSLVSSADHYTQEQDRRGEEEESLSADRSNPLSADEVTYSIAITPWFRASAHIYSVSSFLNPCFYTVRTLYNFKYGVGERLTCIFYMRAYSSIFWLIFIFLCIFLKLLMHGYFGFYIYLCAYMLFSKVYFYHPIEILKFEKCHGSLNKNSTMQK